MSIIKKAVLFARQAHGGQTRRYTGEPYVNHVINVGKMILRLKDNEVTAAAVLHDVVEDTHYTLKDIEHRFGGRVARLVAEVTGYSRNAYPDRARRKAYNKEHFSKASFEGMSIKLADIIDNTQHLAERDPEFAKIYMPEKRELLDVLVGGDSGLWDQADLIISGYFTRGGAVVLGHRHQRKWDIDELLTAGSWGEGRKFRYRTWTGAERYAG